MFQPGQHVTRNDVQNPLVCQITKRHVLHTADGLLHYCYALDKHGETTLFEEDLLTKVELRIGDRKTLAGVGVVTVLSIVEKSDGQRVVVFEIQDRSCGVVTIPYTAALLAPYTKSES